MKIYRVTFLDSADAHRVIWASSRRAIEKEAADLRRRERQDDGIQQVFSVDELEIVPTKKGILQFLTFHANRR